MSITRSNSLRKDSPPQIRRDYLSRLPPPVPEDEGVSHVGPPPGGPPVYQSHYGHHHVHQHGNHPHIANRGHFHNVGYRNDLHNSVSDYVTKGGPPAWDPVDASGNIVAHYEKDAVWDQEQGYHRTAPSKLPPPPPTHDIHPHSSSSNISATLPKEAMSSEDLGASKSFPEQYPSNSQSHQNLSIQNNNNVHSQRSATPVGSKPQYPPPQVPQPHYNKEPPQVPPLDNHKEPNKVSIH